MGFWNFITCQGPQPKDTHQNDCGWEIYWMFGYFSISTLLSIVIIKSPLF
jgi:hypothetical protein